MSKYNFHIPPSTFLVTGGSGFIGSNLCEALLSVGHTVRCLDNFSTGFERNIQPFLSNPAFTLIEGDIRDITVCERACAGVDYVLHQAAWGSVPRSMEMPVQYNEINVVGNLNMMQAARDAKVRRFVYASSSSVYGDDPRLPKKEGQEGNILSPYALTKSINEQYGVLYWRVYGLPTIGLRYFNVFGRRQDANGFYAAVIPKFIGKIMQDVQPEIYGDGSQSRDFTYVDNVVAANLNACVASEDACGKSYNIACGERTGLMDVYRTIRDALGSDLEPKYVGNRPGDIMHSHADISAAQEMLGYHPLFNFEKGIQQAIEWYKDAFAKGLL